VNIIFKGRRTEVQDQFRKHASAKLGKLEKLDHKAMRIDVEVCRERNPRQSDRRERIELTIRSRGPVIRAEAAADDRYVALDRALAKLEERLRRSSSRRKAARGAQAAARASSLRALAGASGAAAAGVPGLAPAGNHHAGRDDTAVSLNGQSGEAATAVVDEEPAAGGARVVPIPMDGDGPLVVREKFHTAAPMSVDQALLEMELVGHDFYLFQDQANDLPSVVYRRRGYDYGLIRLVEQASDGAVGDRSRM
jgi:ribosomal subunit interface protein